jgi:ABC-type antimicrobial peptide transport system permease subunit
MALGAQIRSILALVVREGLGLAALGFAVGLLGAWWLTSLLASLLFFVSPRDFSTLAAVSAVLLGVGFLASLVSARRVMRVDFMVVLRQE